MKDAVLLQSLRTSTVELKQHGVSPSVVLLETAVDRMQEIVEENVRLKTLALSTLSALRDLDAGYPWRELHVNVGDLMKTGAALGVVLDDDECALTDESAGENGRIDILPGLKAGDSYGAQARH